MKTSHITIPQKPSVEVIEAMIEASLDNKNNVEAIYKAIVTHFTHVDMKMAAQSSADAITRVVIGQGEVTKNRVKFVSMTAFAGPRDMPVIGVFSPRTARSVARDLCMMADAAEGKL